MLFRIQPFVVVAALAVAPVSALVQQGDKPEIDPRASKESLHEEMRTLAQQISELRANAAPETRIRALQQRYAAISRSLGGDDPVHLLGSSAPLAGPGASPHPLVAPTACGGASVSTSHVPGVGGPITPPIPFQGVTFTATVSGAGPYLWDVNLTTFITHTFCADLDITLQSPAGTIVTITTDNGGGNDNCFNGTLWDDNVNVPCVDYVYTNLVTAPQLSPEGRLSAFRGEDPNGIWKLKIVDDLGADVGNCNAWSLDISTLAAAPIESTSTSSNTPNLPIPDNGMVADVMAISGLPSYLDKVVLYVEIPHTESQDLDITLTSPGGTTVQVTTDNGGANDNVFNGTTFDPDALDPATDHVYLNLVPATPLSPEGSFDNFLGQNPNGNWTLTVVDDLATDVGTLVRWDLGITTTAPPTPSAYANFAGSTGPIPDNGTATSVPTIYTTTVAGAGSYLWDLDLTTFITHTSCADIDMKLTSPAGTVVIISTDNGGVLDNVFNGTLWDDNCNVPCVDYTYTNLVTATPLSPEGRLAAFRGENPNGVWTLTIEDDALADNGSLSSWALDVSTLNSAPGTVSTTISRLPNLTIQPTAPNTVFDVMPVAGLGTSTVEIEVYLEITHTYAADLDITLTSPLGTVVQLTTDNGGANDNVFNGTLFDGSSTDPVTDHVFTNLVVAPLLAPEGSLDNFMGQDPNGNWTLTVADDAAADGGVFARWDLTIRTCPSAPGTAFCNPGAGGVIACPCGNAPAGPGEGCSNSLGAGASASGSGNASLASDSLVLSASGIHSSGVSCGGNSPTLTCILLQGNALLGAGIGFNDGVRCMGGALKRLQSGNSAGGVFTSTVSISATSAALGDPISAGAHRYYGVWYRDPCASWGCAAPANSNVSNGYDVVWNP